MEAWKAAKNALECVLEAKKNEKIVIFCDDVKMDIGTVFADGALKLGLQTRLMPLKTEAKIYRKQIPQKIMGTIFKQPPDIYINLFRGNREEAPFRIKLMQMEIKKPKTRLGHCPGVTLDMLTDGALALTVEEHKKMQNFATRLIQKLGKAVKVKITNPAGTDVTLNVEGRPFFTDTMIDWEKMTWMNLPTGEVLAAPQEDSMEGTLVCDMAIGGIGKLENPINLAVHKGKVQNSSTKDQQMLKRVQDSLNTDEGSNVVGEFAFGINPKARFVDEFLEAEKIPGTIHIAFGNNSDMPCGANKSKNHMDLLVSKPTVRIFSKDGTSSDILADGVFQNI